MYGCRSSVRWPSTDTYAVPASKCDASIREIQYGLGPAKAPGAGTGVGHAGEGNGANAGAGDATAGQAVFSDNCSSCHGASGMGGNGGPDLTAIAAAADPKHVVTQVTNGGGGMPAFKGSLTPKQIQDVAAYVAGKIAKKG